MKRGSNYSLLFPFRGNGEQIRRHHRSIRKGGYYMENWQRGEGWGGKKHKNITEPHAPNSNMADNTCTRLGQIMKSRLLRKHLGEQVAIIWYIVWKHRLYLHYFTIYLHIIDMPTSCCVPQCNQQGFTTPTGEKAGKGYHKDITEPQRESGKFYRGMVIRQNPPTLPGEGRVGSLISNWFVHYFLSKKNIFPFLSVNWCISPFFSRRLCMEVLAKSRVKLILSPTSITPLEIATT